MSYITMIVIAIVVFAAGLGVLFIIAEVRKQAALKVEANTDYFAQAKHNLTYEPPRTIHAVSTIEIQKRASLDPSSVYSKQELADIAAYKAFAQSRANTRGAIRTDYR